MTGRLPSGSERPVPTIRRTEAQSAQPTPAMSKTSRSDHDLTDRVLNLHLAEPQPAQLHESVAHVVQGHVHNRSPHLSRYVSGQEFR
jgi:hypothetical protein